MGMAQNPNHDSKLLIELLVVGSYAFGRMGGRKTACSWGAFCFSTKIKTQPHYDKQNNLLYSWR